MKNAFRRSDISDLFENAITRVDQLVALAIIVRDSLDAHSIDKKALQDTLWLMTDILEAHRSAIEHLQRLQLSGKLQSTE